VVVREMMLDATVLGAVRTGMMAGGVMRRGARPSVLGGLH
jgi:hypothetical protein